MSTDRDPPPLHPRVARGQRPHFFADESSDTLLSMNLALLTELMATRERLDTLERVMAARGLLEPGSVEAYAPDAAAEEERETLRTTMANHVFYLLLQEAERAGRAPVAARSAAPDQDPPAGSGPQRE